MNIRRQSIVWFLVVFCGFIVLTVMTVGRSSASDPNPNCINQAPAILTHSTLTNDLMSYITNEREKNSQPAIRWLEGAMNSAQYIAQTLSTEGYTLDENLYVLDEDSNIEIEKPILLEPIMIDGCAIDQFIVYNVPDVQTVNKQAFELNNENSLNDLINYINNHPNTNLILQDGNTVAEMGIGHVKTADGKHVFVFIWTSREHISPDYAPPGNDSVYDGCGDADTLGSANDTEIDQTFTQELFNSINNARPEGMSFNQGGEDTQEIVNKLDHVAQYLAQDMAHDYYHYNEEGGLIDRDANGHKTPVMITRDGEEIRCHANILLEQHFPDQTIQSRIFSIDDYTQYGSSYWFENAFPYSNISTAVSIMSLSDWLNEPQYEYMSIGYAESESGSIRAVIMIIEEPIVQGTLPEPPIGDRPEIAQPIGCEPSNGLNDFSIQPGQIGTSQLPLTFTDGSTMSVPYIIMIGENYDPDTPTLLTFYLHGDGGKHDLQLDNNGYYSTSNLAFQELINENGWIYIAPQAPTQPIPEGDNVLIEPPWHPWYGGANPYDLNHEEAQKNGLALVTLFKMVQEKFNVCKNISLGATASGGSFFYDSHFIPRHGIEYPAYVALHCGSGGIRNVDEQNTQLSTQWVSTNLYDDIQKMSEDQALMDQIELSYVMGEYDDRPILWPNIWYSIQTYDKLGYDVERQIVPDVKHCDDPDYDVTAMITEYWREKAADIALPISTTPLTVKTIQNTASSPFPFVTILFISSSVGMSMTTFLSRQRKYRTYAKPAP